MIRKAIKDKTQMLQDALKANRLSSREEKEVYYEINKLVAKINSGLRKKRIKAKVVLGGSAAKKTFLKGDFDCDIFVKFDYSYAKENSKLSDYLEKALGGLKNVERVHGSRDYFQIRNRNESKRESVNFEINFEIIPVLAIKSSKDALNVTDASPMHVEWVLKHMKMDKSMRDSILLTKLFCKANGIYGAESYIKGFSGHVIDILTIYYKGFLPLLQNASRWEDKVVIDIQNYHKGKALQSLNASKTQSPIVLVDPIQPERNAAASVSKEKFDLFRKKAKEFINAPSKDFFIRKEATVEGLKKVAGKEMLAVVKAIALEGKEDVVGSKLLKCFEHISNKIDDNGFSLLDKGWSWDKKKEAMLWFIVKKQVLSEFFVKEGPPVSQKGHVKRFMAKNKSTFVKGERIYANAKREHTNVDSLIKAAVKDSYIKERLKSIKAVFY